MAPPGTNTSPPGTEMSSTRTCAFRERARRQALAPRLPPHRPLRSFVLSRREHLSPKPWKRGANNVSPETKDVEKRRTQPRGHFQGHSKRALEGMSETTPWWERPSTQPADGRDDGCSISTSVTVRLREPQDSHQFRSSRRRRRMPPSSSPTHLTLSSPPRSTRARPRPMITA